MQVDNIFLRENSEYTAIVGIDLLNNEKELTRLDLTGDNAMTINHSDGYFEFIIENNLDLNVILHEYSYILRLLKKYK